MIDRRRMLREYGLTTGSLGAASGQTLMVAVLPLLLVDYAPSAVWIGGVIAGEGAFAIAVPYVVGVLSDTLPPSLTRRFGRRTFFLLLASPVMAAAVAIAPFTRSFWLMAGAAFVSFAALHTFLTPLRALVIDTVPRERWGRVQGVLGAFHAGGLGYGLVAGGLLFALWPPLPFLLGAALILTTTAVTYFATPAGSREYLVPSEHERKHRVEGRLHREIEFWRDLLRRGGVRWFLVANALWTGAVDGIRPYVFLFAMVVLGVTVAEASLVLTVLLAGVAVGSILLGRLGDRYGRPRLLLASALLTGAAMSFGVLVRTVPSAILVLLPAGLGAAALIALPYPVFASLAHSETVGRYTAVYTLSVGFARIGAPIIVGAAIDLGTPLMPEVEGFPLMWAIAGLFGLLSAFALWRADVSAGGALLRRVR